MAGLTMNSQTSFIDDESLSLPQDLQDMFGGGMVQVNDQALVNLGAQQDQLAPQAQPLVQQPQVQQPQGYAQGGLVEPPTGNVGLPQPQGAIPTQPPAGVGLAQESAGNYQISPNDAQQFVQQHPEQVQQIAAQLQQSIAAGEVTPEQVQMAGQLASVALQNPEMYPRLRQYAIQQGLIDEADIPQEFDQGFLFTVVLAAQSLASGGQAGQAAQPEPINMADGGVVRKPKDAGGVIKGPGTETSDSIPINASVNEYIIPAHVVHMKGREFFDNLLEKYKDAASD